MTHHVVDIDKLDPKQRLELIGDLWESLRAHPESVRLTRAQRNELDRRLDELDRGETEAVSWEDAKRRLHSRRK